MSDYRTNKGNLERALKSLKDSVSAPIREKRDLSGIIKDFELVYELTWKTLQSLLKEEGISAPFPRVVFEEAFKRGLFTENHIWKEIMEARNRSTHVYSEEDARKLSEEIIKKYYASFEKCFREMSAAKP
jgi:nucleotidyltransferase substrate binding protein (TIGR01987 family)